MNEWMEGYISDVEYTANYYKELDPNLLNLTAVLNDIEPIPVDEPFNYCELGCGKGITILALAANYPSGKFYAIDFNPSYIASARRIAEKANLTNIYFFEESFQELIDKPDLLPQMNFIIFHGIYTWISDENRLNLIKLCYRHLLSGGFVYNSYNAKPGWNDVEPLQKLIIGLSTEYPGTSLNKMDTIIHKIEKLQEIKSGYFEHKKDSIKNKINKMKAADNNYLVHEYLNKDWRAFYFPEVSKEMENAKLNYLCQASPSEIYTATLLPQEVTKQLSDIYEQNNRELLIDLFVNRVFRRDMYTRGISKNLNSVERHERLLEKEWILINHDKIEAFNFSLSVGNIQGDKKIYDKIILALKNDILSTKELQRLSSLDDNRIIQALMFLYDANYIAMYQKHDKEKVTNLNKVFASSVFEKYRFKYVIAAHIKQAVPMNDINMAWLDGLYKGFTSRKELVEYVYQSFTKLNMSISHENKVLKNSEMKKHLYNLEIKLRKKLLPFWQKLGIL